VETFHHLMDGGHRFAFASLTHCVSPLTYGQFRLRRSSDHLRTQAPCWPAPLFDATLPIGYQALADIEEDL
jgi:hypothetical protein